MRRNLITACHCVSRRIGDTDSAAIRNWRDQSSVSRIAARKGSVPNWLSSAAQVRHTSGAKLAAKIKTRSQTLTRRFKICILNELIGILDDSTARCMSLTFLRGQARLRNTQPRFRVRGVQVHVMKL